ncbi:hypothetical protein U27_00388 [Candidatus Vecturithrix granuli]|uniref:Uncharacterized protein n=1 Tax=Vecturithrix granuli TaxID=1499967 RepID=A0A081C7D6_VECG1|nr:hypothetical protein U27_00388 [Candidatus Vecturithrix granuli]
MLLAEPIYITQRIAREFDQLGIQYLVGGSLASSLHGIPRATNDVDMVANITYAHIPDLVNALEAEFYIDAGMIHDAIQHQSSFNVIHLATMFKVDIFVLKSDGASQEEMRRRGQYQVSEIPDETLFLASAEDVIVHKLYWYQLGGNVSERQWTDVLGVLQVQGGQLDYPYLNRMAHHRGVRDLLTQAMNEAEQEKV